jgi:hypothetical protein
MKLLSRNQFLTAVLAGLLLSTLQAKSIETRTENTWMGYLVDSKCAESFKHLSDPLQAAREHRKACLIEPESVNSGYELYANDKWYKLDRLGNRLAQLVANESISQHGVYVSVMGKLDGNFINVQKIVEVMVSPSKNDTDFDFMSKDSNSH